MKKASIGTAMKIDGYEVLVTSHPELEDLMVEFGIDNRGIGSVIVQDGKPVIRFGPNPKDASGVWTIDYQTFKQIVAALDMFLVSIGYPPDEQGNGALSDN